MPFCLQSTSKPLTYALALNENGAAKVHEHVGQEPSGEAFNMIKLDNNSRCRLPVLPAPHAAASPRCVLPTLAPPRAASSPRDSSVAFWYVQGHRNG